MKFRWSVVWALVVPAAAVAGWLVYGRVGGGGTASRRIRAGYSKHEYRIPMRDGVTLFTQVYVPRDGLKRYPLLVQRTPFGVTPYGEDEYRGRLGPAAEFDRSGYIFVFQDVRGRFQSEGTFVDMRPHVEHPAPGETDESTDMADTVAWLLQHVPGNNGRVGIWGMSYPGFYAAASVIDAHPAIKAASIQAPMMDLFLGDDAYHNGVFQMAAQFSLYANYFRPRGAALEFPSANIGHFFDYGTEDGYRFYQKHGPGLRGLAALARNPLLDENVRHNTYDEYWRARDLSQHLHGIRCPVLSVGGWFDAEDLGGTFRSYQAIQAANREQQFFVVGPWGHGDWLRSAGRRLGDLDFGSETGTYFRSNVLFPFFEHFLKDAPAPDLPGALVFETGTNQWQRYPQWPPPGARPRSLFLHAGGKLDFEPPTAREGEPKGRPGSGYDEYVSDPAKPVPYLAHPPVELSEDYMYGDQRFATGRADVLTYRTEPLEQDLTVVGPIEVRLQVSSTGTDADFVVKLIDEDAGGVAGPGTGLGVQRLVRGEPMRARFRNSFTRPEPLQPNAVTALRYTMPDIHHTFLRGHRILVQVQSSWFPLADLNPQTFVDIAQAGPGDFVKATQRVYHAPQAASSIVLMVLER